MKLQIIFLLFNVVVEFESKEKNYVTRSKIIQTQQESQWSREVITKIKKDPRIYQIMLLSNYEHLENWKIIQNLQKNLPTLYFNESYSKRELQNLQQRNSFINPRATTLFIIVESSEKNNTQRTEGMMEFIKNLIITRIRPKCLILRFLDSNDETSDYRKFLQKMWHDLFLDITVLDVIKGRAMIHQLNPFVSYTAKPFTRRTSLFPNKLRNLNGYPIKVAMFYQPPFTKLKRNSKNYPIDISGPNIQIEKMFAELLHYREVLVPSKEESFGRFSCNVDELTGFDADLQQSKIQFIGATSITIRQLCKTDIFENAILSIDRYVAVIPTLKSNNVSITIGNTFYNSILLTVLITITCWICIKCFNFDRKIWNWSVIIQILFGIAVVHQPRILKERIIFICLLILNLYYACNMLSSLTNFKLRVKNEREINTITDLINSGLHYGSSPIIISTMPSILERDDFTAWVKNGQLFDQPEDCIEFLLDYKNISCIMRATLAEWHVGFYVEQNLMKYIPEIIISVGIGFVLEPGSPYVEKLEKVHRLLTEFALLEKWKIRKLPNVTRFQEQGTTVEVKLNESDAEGKIEPILFGLLITGYVISLLSFVVELAIYKWKRRR